MNRSTVQPTMTSMRRALALAVLFALTALALLLPARTAQAFSMPPLCNTGYSEQVLYYNTFNHQSVIGETDIDCSGIHTHTGQTSPYYSYTCTACP